MAVMETSINPIRHHARTQLQPVGHKSGPYGDNSENRLQLPAEVQARELNKQEAGQAQHQALKRRRRFLGLLFEIMPHSFCESRSDIEIRMERNSDSALLSSTIRKRQPYESWAIE